MSGVTDGSDSGKGGRKREKIREQWASVRELGIKERGNRGVGRGPVRGWRVREDRENRGAAQRSTGEVSAMHSQLKRCSSWLRRATRFCICVTHSLHAVGRVGIACRCVVTHCPEFNEILQDGGCNEQTVHQRVGQEEDEKLVVGESHTVVHPADTQTPHLDAVSFPVQKPYQSLQKVEATSEVAPNKWHYQAVSEKV